MASWLSSAALAVLAAAGLAGPVTADSATVAAEPLAAASASVRQIAAGESHRYGVDLAKGEVLHVELEEHGIDVEVALDGPAPGGASSPRLAGSDGPDGGEDLELLTWVAGEEGRYLLTVRARQKEEPGGYLLTRAGARDAAHLDAKQMEAEQQFGAGTAALTAAAEVTPEARRTAIARYEEALAAARRAGYGALAARTLSSMGVLRTRLEENDAAALLLEEAATRWAALPRPRGEARALDNLSDALKYSGGQPRCTVASHRAAVLWEAAGAARQRAYALHLAAQCASFFSDPSLGLPDLETAIGIYRQLGRTRDLAVGLEVRGLYQLASGLLTEAEASFAEALPLAEQASERLLVAEITAVRGNVLNRRGRLEEAMAQYRRAIPLWRAIDVKRGEGQALGYLGLTHARLGQHREALARYEEAIAVLRDHGYLAVALYHAAVAHRELGEPDRARARIEESLASFRHPRTRWGEAMALAELGSLRAEAGEAAAGEELIRQGLAQSRELGDLQRIPIALDALGKVARQRGDLATAVASHQEALGVRRQLGDVVGQAGSLVELARTERARGDLDAARTRVEEALALCERLRRNFQSEALRAQYQSSVRGYYELYLDILHELEGRHPGKGPAEAALVASERARARVLLDLLAAGRIDPTAGIDQERRSRWQAMQAQISDVSAALLAGAQGRRAAELEEQLRGLEDQRTDLAAEIRLDSPRYAELALPEPPDAAALARLLGPDEVLLEYFLGKEHSFLIVVTTGGVRLHALPAESEVAPLVETLRQGLRQPGRRQLAPILAAARRLYELLVAPAAPELAERQRLLIAADGALHYLPFEVLLTAAPGGADWAGQPFVLRRHAVAYLPSASVLAVLRGGDRAASPGLRTLVALADPAYGPAAPSSSLQPLLRSVEESGSGWRLRQLPGTAREANAIADLFPRRQASLFLGAAAREETLEREAPGARYLHLAAHAVVSESHPEASAVVLALDGDPAEDGLLQVGEIFDLRLGADLVVLSACETALGRDVRGEGMIGFGRAFLYAGASTLVASLWQVEDRSTAELMVAFYRRLARGEDRAEALRRAKLALLDRAELAHPFYWAPFVLIGEGR